MTCFHSERLSEYPYSVFNHFAKENNHTLNGLRCLPPAFRRNGKDSVFRGVCLSTPREGVPHLHPIILPSTGPMFFHGGYPSAWFHVPYWRVTPIQFLMGGTPIQSWQALWKRMEYPPPNWDWMGSVGTGWGTPTPFGLDGVLPCWDWMEVPTPLPHQDWRSEQYASCFHAGGLSYFNLFLCSFQQCMAESYRWCFLHIHMLYFWEYFYGTSTMFTIKMDEM